MSECKRPKLENNSKPSLEDDITKKLEHFKSPLNENFLTPDKKSACTWKPEKNAKNPHRTTEWRQKHKILPNVLHAIGNTPLIKLNNIPKSLGIKCEVLVKCEFFNPGGSVKERIAVRLVEDAEKAGILKPGSTIIEPTSGNTGIGLALAAAVKGYRCVIVISEKMSSEKVDVLKALGAEVIRTPVSASSDAPNGLFGVSNRLKKEIPNSIILDQYSNPGNPLAHYDTTAEEILDQCDGKLNMIVIGAGTGGTITGIGRKIKEASPKTIIVGVDPEGSILALPESLNKTDVDFYEVEGVGYDFLPTVLDRSVVDKWLKMGDKEALPMARRLIRDEGLLCGGSSGLVVAGALKMAATLKEGQRVVIILPDSIRNYITKFVSDQWLEVRNLKTVENTQKLPWWDTKIEKLPLLPPLVAVKAESTLKEVVQTLKTKNISQASVIKKDGSILGVVTLQGVLNALTSKLTAVEPVSKVVEGVFPKIQHDSSLGVLSRILEKQPFAVVLKNDKPIGVLTQVEFLDFITK